MAGQCFALANPPASFLVFSVPITQPLDVESGKPVIDGRALKVSLTKKDAQVFGAVRLWDKTKRGTLTPEARLAFFKAATSCILPKGNKLSAPYVVTADNDELLAQVENLQ